MVRSTRFFSVNKRHLIKSITWRIVGSFDTLILSFVIFRDYKVSLFISITEVFSKLILYYFHERLWYFSNIKKAKLRHLIKPFTWRFIATMDTLLISLFFFKQIDMAFQLSLLEIFTKTFLYYLHDKLWYKSKFGLNGKR